MTQPLKGFIEADWSRGRERIMFQFNPTEVEYVKGVHIAEITIPGLDAPLLQFIRGQNETLTFTLFFDTTEDGMGDKAKSVTELVDKVYGLTKIDPDTHAPPVCFFVWNSLPGSRLSRQTGNQSRSSFKCLVEKVQHKYTLFSPKGLPLRAFVTLTLREYKPLDTQLEQLGLNSPDKTQVRVLRADETLSSIAGEHYRRSGEWRTIATANGIEDPRRLRPGVFLTLPPLD